MKERKLSLELEPQYPAPKWVRYSEQDNQKLIDILRKKGSPVNEISPNGFNLSFVGR